MSREIKFRFVFHHKDLGFTALKIYTLEELLVCPLQNLADIASTYELIAKQEYTGLRDKNGVEIYEGDIVASFGDDYYRVVTDIRHDCFVTNSVLSDGNCDEDPEFNTSVVIGNIHKNPELLEQS